MTDSGDLVRALDACLELIRADGLDADEAASRFPEIADDLRGPLEMATLLDASPPLPAPSREFVCALAADLVAAPPPRALRGSAPRPQLSWARNLFRSGAAVAAGAAAVVVFLFGGAVYASADDLPGDALYSVKRAVESARVLVAGDGELQLRLELADRRLAEALLVPGSAGDLLADFSYEVTSALGEADYALEAGAPAGEIVPPLVRWLLSAREQLVAARPKLPPTAWRAALALVDEAIVALRSEHAQASRPVWRLVDAGDVLRSSGSGTLPRLRSDVARIDWPFAGGPGVDESPSVPLDSAARAELPHDGVELPVGEPNLPTDGSIAVPPEPTPTAGACIGPTEEPRQPTEEPPPRDPKATDVPTMVATATSTPMALPTEEPPPEPSTTPSDPGDAGATGTPTGVTATPTLEPTATDVPENRPPEILECTCNPQTVKVYGESQCEVIAEGPDGDVLSYQWTVDAGVMEDSDQPIAYYQAQIRIGGIAKVDIPIHIVVRDPHGAEATRIVYVIVTPRVSKVGQSRPLPPGDRPDGEHGSPIVELEQPHAR